MPSVIGLRIASAAPAWGARGPLGCELYRFAEFIADPSRRTHFTWYPGTRVAGSAMSTRVPAWVWVGPKSDLLGS
eukprot:3760949-Rhodomonas_salina.2